jgi:UDP-N-acetylmuramoylalanine--D-glutamate ligase
LRIAGQEIEDAAVLGYAHTGRATMQFLLNHGVRPFVSDSGPLSKEDRAELEAQGVQYEEDGHTEATLADPALIVLSPGVRPNLPLLVEARKRGIMILSELDLAAEACHSTNSIAISGTNGKSTTVRITEALLRMSGKKVIVAGNIGIPFTSIVDQVVETDVVVLEVSSFQLEQSESFHPRVAVLLNITPDHLDRHKTIAAYTAAKGRLFQNQTREDTTILSSNLIATFPKIRAQKVLFDLVELPPSPFLADLSPHNQENLKAAIAACRALLPNFDAGTIQFDDLKKALALPYRLQEEGEVNGIRVINDSKSTNAASTLVALQSVDRPVILLLGGKHKGAGYEPLAAAISERSVRKVILYGEAASSLHKTLKQAGYASIALASDLSQAVDIAFHSARNEDVLLFSPACSSYDQYSNYIERGKDFTRLIQRHRL